ncbi:NAD(P)-dependent oxidoreductase [Streptomyces sp. NBC_00842]|uniref:NAD(P)-dependent oxidoreductase n=1 Tax=Streptomyces sp. NBC_00842 TaxID=2975848 RepID=UPI00386F669C|nr:NAD(P)-binding domain-containing protein [Streptomyces sp. NBC_00842]
MTPSASTSTPAPAPVTVIGLGAMGRALAGAFLDAGHPTTVWNRSTDKGEELVARGAVRAPSAEEAVHASELVVVCVVDHDAAHTILAPLTDALAGRVLVNLTSDTPDRARAAAAWADAHSLDYLEGAIMVPIEVIGTPGALIFYAGSQRAYDRYGTVLKALGANAPFLGQDHALAAAYDMAMLDFFYGSMAGLVHAFALARAENIPAAALAPYLQTIVNILPPIVTGTAADIDARKYDGVGANLAMMTASVDHLLHAARDKGLDTSQLRAIKSVSDRAIAQGPGADSWASTVEALGG